MKKLWGGRFKKEMNPLLKCFSYSLGVDIELLESELEVNEAWVKMLGRMKVLTSGEVVKLLSGLKAVAKEWIAKKAAGLSRQDLARYEDVHTLIQSALEQKAGQVAKKLHTGRSRNDLVITSTRVYLRGKLAELDQASKNLQGSLVLSAEKAGDGLIAGLTHLKKAQPVLMAHHLLAYVEMIEEDRERFIDLGKRIDVLPLGAAALAGSALPLDQKFLARELGFSKIAANSMAAVSDRAIIVEFLAGLSILWMHLSRLAEDFTLWNSEQFKYVDLDDAYATGSSLMPQKKNPDVFELVRGRTSVIFGHLQSLLVLQKGLPLAYNRDLQDDKPAMFDAIRKTFCAVNLLGFTLASVTFNRAAMEASVQDDNLFATDMLEYLVRKGVAFSEAHAIVGKIVARALDAKRSIRRFSLNELKAFSKCFDDKVYELFEPHQSVTGKKTIGSTHPARVRGEILRWKKLLEK